MEASSPSTIIIIDGAQSAEFRKGDEPMKINRFFALAVIALLIVGAMGAISLNTFAKGTTAPAAQVSVQAPDCSQDQADGTEVKSATDADNVELQCGDQVEDGLPDSAAAPAQGMSLASGVAAAAAQAAPLASAVNTTVSSTTLQSDQQIEDGLPDGGETSGGEEITNGPDTDNIQQQDGDQFGQQVEDGQPDSSTASVQ
jgi:hypothetical protein